MRLSVGSSILRSPVRRSARSSRLFSERPPFASSFGYVHLGGAKVEIGFVVVVFPQMDERFQRRPRSMDDLLNPSLRCASQGRSEKWRAPPQLFCRAPSISFFPLLQFSFTTIYTFPGNKHFAIFVF